jgi:hypothetical protein
MFVLQSYPVVEEQQHKSRDRNLKSISGCHKTVTVALLPASLLRVATTDRNDAANYITI